MVIVDFKDNNDKEVKIYPYRCSIKNEDIKINNFSEIFKIENAKDNVVEYVSDTYLVLVIDEIFDGFMFGRFFKLRDDSPTIFNRKEGKEKDIELLSEENIKEESHFILNVKDCIIFAEYNFSAIRMFSYPLSYYLNEKFKLNDCTIEAIEDKDTFNNLKTEEEILSLTLGFAQDSTKILEEKYNMPAWRGLLDIGRDNESFFEVNVRRCRKKDSKLNKEKVIDMVGNLIQNKAPIDSIKVETQDIVYDLVKNNLLFYYLSIKKDGRKLDKDDFNYKTQALYKKYIATIKKNLRKD